jgi:hypothetical protein
MSDMIPPEEPEYTPAEYCGDCIHQGACRMQWERFNGELEDGYEGWLEALALALGCGEDCMAYED